MPRQIDGTGFGDIRIIQDSGLFKYGIDAVLLAGYAAEGGKKVRRAADLGTGNGIVPLVLCHKTEIEEITGFEIQRECAELAEENVRLNRLDDRIGIRNLDVRDIPGDADLRGKFDMVTTNPPYKKADSGIVSENRAVAVARHEIEGNLEDFLKAAAWILKDRGVLCMVHRPKRLVDICEISRKHRLEPKEITFVSPYPETEPNIMLIKCVKNGGNELKVGRNIHVREENEKFSKKVKEIYEKPLLINGR